MTIEQLKMKTRIDIDVLFGSLVEITEFTTPRPAAERFAIIVQMFDDPSKDKLWGIWAGSAEKAVFEYEQFLKVHQLQDLTRNFLDSFPFQFWSFESITKLREISVFEEFNQLTFQEETY